MLSLVLNCIDRLNVYTTAAHFAEFAGEEAAESWKEIVNLLYELLGKGPQSLFPQEHPSSAVPLGLTPLPPAASLIRGSRANCALFSTNLDWLVSKLDRLEASSGRRTLSSGTGMAEGRPWYLTSPAVTGRHPGGAVLCAD
jgi:hypothetical protein